MPLQEFVDLCNIINIFKATKSPGDSKNIDIDSVRQVKGYVLHQMKKNKLVQILSPLILPCAEYFCCRHLLNLHLITQQIVHHPLMVLNFGEVILVLNPWNMLFIGLLPATMMPTPFPHATSTLSDGLHVYLNGGLILGVHHGFVNLGNGWTELRTFSSTRHHIGWSFLCLWFVF